MAFYNIEKNNFMLKGVFFDNYFFCFNMDVSKFVVFLDIINNIDIIKDK